MKRLLLVALLVGGCTPAAAIEPYETHDGYGIHLMAVDVPAGAIRYEWTADGSCNFDVKFGHAKDAVPVWDAEPVSVAVGVSMSESGTFDLPVATTVLQIQGTGCHWSFAYRPA